MERVTTPFSFSSTALDVVDGVDLSGKRAIVTGGSTGIGLETTRALVHAGAEVTVATRNVERARNVLGDSVDVRFLDLADLASVRTLCDQWSDPLDILVCNAGIMGLPTRELSPEGIEMQMAVNHVGHFVLANGLHNQLSSATGARVVVVSSQAHSFAPVDFHDINFDVRPYDPIVAYCQSKSANALFALGASSRWAPDGIAVNACTPGAIHTDLQVHLGGKFSTDIPDSLIKSPAQGAATSVLLVASPLLEGVTGKYFVDCNEGVPSDVRLDDFTGILPFVRDPTLADRLWDWTRSVTNYE